MHIQPQTGQRPNQGIAIDRTEGYLVHMSKSRFQQVSSTDRPRHRGRPSVALWRIKRFKHCTVAAFDARAPLPAELAPFAEIIEQADQAERGGIPVTDASHMTPEEWRALIIASMPRD